jgi:hypothetical protein
MSKKHKSNRKQVQQAAKKAVAPPAVIMAKNGRDRPAETNSATNVMPPQAETVRSGTVTQKRDGQLPFWARMPFAIMDFWLSRPGRERANR